jgi:hypothetical protein
MGKVTILLLVFVGTVMVSIAGQSPACAGPSLPLRRQGYGGLAGVGSTDFRNSPSRQSYERWRNIEFVGHYSFKGDVFEDKDLSGIACVSETQCLLGADEGRQVQVGELSKEGKWLRVLTDVALVDSGKEIDIEAIAAEIDCYYIVGSHGLAKKDGEFQENRYKIFRLKVDPATGLPAGAPAPKLRLAPAPVAGAASAKVLQVTSLSDILKADAVLGPYFQKPLQHNGVNIEGLAVKHGQLFVGFRSPNLGGKAYVMEIAAERLFGDKKGRNYRLHSFSLGQGYGIRELVAAQSCFLIIAGNSGSEPSDKFPKSENYQEDRGYVMYSWDGSSSKVHRIGPIENPPGKAEAMTVLSESEQQMEVLILFDGADKGRPSVYRIY